MSRQILQYPDKKPASLLTLPPLGMYDYVCERMRPDEIAQYMALAAPGRGEEEFNPRTAALGFANADGVSAAIMRKDGLPAAIGGYSMDPYMPGVWNSWMAGTELGWKENWLDITKGVRWLIAQLMDGGARRLETNVLASRKEAQQWYVDFLGLKYEGERRGYTTTGESVLLYGLTKEDWNGRWE